MAPAQEPSTPTRPAGLDKDTESVTENRTLFGPDSASHWAAAESTLEASAHRTRTGQPALHWHITVDYSSGEAKYPIGWPRISIPLREVSSRDWSGWDYLQFWVYTETSRHALPREPVGLALYTPNKASAFNRALDELKKDAWTRVRIPLSQVPRHHDVRLMQFHIAESKYRDRDELDFYFDDINLLRYAQPTLLNFAAENVVMFTDAKRVPVHFNLTGVKPGESVELTCALKLGARVITEKKAIATRGPQRVALELGEAAMDPGTYQVEARAAGGTETAGATVRFVESPWK